MRAVVYRPRHSKAGKNEPPVAASGLDTFIVNSSQSLGTVGGSGDVGAISGYDIITDFATTGTNDILNLPVTSVTANTIGTNGADAALTISGQTAKSHAVTSGITGVPSGWTLSNGTDNGDGRWTVQANDVSTLSITASVGYAGAVSLHMSHLDNPSIPLRKRGTPELPAHCTVDCTVAGHYECASRHRTPVGRQRFLKFI